MKKWLCAALAAALLLTLFSSCSASGAEYKTELAAAQGNISVVSFNVAAPWGNVLKGTGSGKRVKLFAAYMNAVHPDSIGTQEMNSDWLEKLTELMPEYASYGVKRGGDDSEKKSEMNAVFWLKDKYDSVEQNTFWLTETPETQSKYEGAGCYRICSYVVLQNKETGRQYIHMNTHLDNASEAAADYGAQVICSYLTRLQTQYPQAGVVLTGDFNEYRDGAACQTVAQVLNNTAEAAANPETLRPTYQQWGELEEKDGGGPIDYIFTSGTDVARTAVLDDLSNGYISDHYGVFAEIAL